MDCPVLNEINGSPFAMYSKIVRGPDSKGEVCIPRSYLELNFVHQHGAIEVPIEKLANALEN